MQSVIQACDFWHIPLQWINLLGLTNACPLERPLVVICHLFHSHRALLCFQGSLACL